MKKLQAFLLFSSGAEQSILKKCPSDVNRYTAIGATVVFTGLLAFVSASYALHTVFQSILISMSLGFVWGLMIYNLDRFIVLSLRSTGTFGKDVLVALPRMLLALLFAVVISTPLELRIFENEIEGELVLMNQEQRKTQEDAAKARFAEERTTLLNTRSSIEAEVSTLRTSRDKLSLIALQEADGTGGSMKRNLGPIYAAKKVAADKATEELVAKEASSQSLLSNIETALTKNMREEQLALSTLAHIPMNGLIARLEALGRLTSRSSIIYTAHLFIFLLFLALELAPLLVKILSLKSPYDLVLAGHEKAYETTYNIKMHRAKAEMNEKIEVGTEVTVHRTTATIEAEKAMIDKKLKEKLRTITENTNGWERSFGI
jgi:hypothetical protein